jgi:hypothetical protein
MDMLRFSWNETVEVTSEILRPCTKISVRHLCNNQNGYQIDALISAPYIDATIHCLSFWVAGGELLTMTPTVELHARIIVMNS